MNDYNLPEFVKTKTYAQALAEHSLGTLYFPTDEPCIIFGLGPNANDYKVIGLTNAEKTKLGNYPTIGSGTSTYLRNDGTWDTPLADNERVTAEAISELYADIEGLRNKNYIEECIIGPYSAVDGSVVVFDKETGKKVRSSGFTIGKSVPANAIFTDQYVTSYDNHYNHQDTSKGGSDNLISVRDENNTHKVVTGLTVDQRGHVRSLARTDIVWNDVVDHPTDLGNFTNNAGYVKTDTHVTEEQYHYTPSADQGYGINFKPDGISKIITAISRDSKGHIVEVSSENLTKNLISLGNVDNTSDLNKPISTAVQNAFDTYNKVIGEAISEIYADIDGLKHKEINEASYKQSGLMHFEDKIKLDSVESGAQVHIAPTEIEVKTALGVGSGTSKYLREDGTWVTPPNDDTHTNKAGHYTPSDKDTSWASGNALSIINQIKTDDKGHITEVSEYALTLTLLGLNNVTNDAQVKRTEMGVANGVATLDSNGLIISSQLPGYVDGTIEGYLYNEHCYADAEHTTIKVDKTGKSADRLDGKIYVNLHDSNTYRWSGSVYVEISKSLALGTTSTTAFRGDYGNIAYSHATDGSRLTSATPVGLYKVGSTAEGHIVGLTAIEKSDITALGIPGENSWRPIKVKGTSLQSSVTIDFIEGNNITIEEGSPNNGSIKISASWRPLGTGANDACAGNDSRLSDARPASDVYSWAKQSVKPGYAISEIVGLADAIALRDKVIAEAISECKSDIIGLQNKNYTEGFVKAPYSANDGEIAVFDKETGTLIKGGGKTIANLTATASTSANGLMSATDKSKLDGIASGATAVSEQTVSNWGFTKNGGTVTSVKVGETVYNQSNGVISLPAYLPASGVSSWAKEPNKPSYNYSEIIGHPTKVSELTNDSGFTTNIGTVTGVKVGSTSYNPDGGIVSLPAYPTSLPASDVYSWAKQSSKPSYAINEITGLSSAISDRDRILAEAIAELKAEVEGLKKVINSLPQWVDAENGYMINGQKMFDVIDYDPFEESKPELPKSIGLIRYSTRSERIYVSISVTNDVNDWGVC